MKKLFLLGATALLAVSSANAAIVPVLLGITPDISTGFYVFTYDVQVQSPDTQIQSPTTAGPNNSPAGGYDNHFTFFDFEGYQGVKSCVGLFCGVGSFSAPVSGPAAYLQAPPDLGTIANPTFTFQTSPAVSLPTGSSSIIALLSTYSNVKSIVFSGQSAVASGALAGTVDGNSVNTLGPSSTPLDGTVPEPASILLMGAGITALVIARRRLA